MFLLGSGLELVGVTHVSVGIALMVLGFALLAVSGYVALRERANKTGHKNGEPSVTQLPPAAWEGLTQAEDALARIVEGEVIWNHGHSDYIGIVDDIQRGNPLAGPCSVCGEPRVREGKEHGEVHDDHNG